MKIIDQILLFSVGLLIGAGVMFYFNEELRHNALKQDRECDITINELLEVYTKDHRKD